MTIDGHLSPVAPQTHTASARPRPVETGIQTPTQAPTSVEPPGVTPELWKSLSPEEQAFFTAQAVRGMLTYGPSESHTVDNGTFRGQRIDMRA